MVTLSDLRSQFSRVKTGILLEPDEVKVLSDAKGKIQSISFPVGAEVKHGQPVIQIEDAFYLYTQGLDEAKTAYDNAQYQYDTRKNDSQKELSLIETEIKSLNTQMSSLENQIFSLSEMNQEKQEQKQQEALQKNQSLSQNLQNLWQDFSAQLSQIDTSELSFSSEYVSSLTSLSSSLSQGDFFSVLQSNRQFLSKFSDFCYLLHSAGREETFIASVLQQIKELQSQLDTLQSDFSSFFFDTFQTERQQSLTKLSQEIEEVEGNLNQKNLEYEERKNLIQTELKELSTTLDHTRNDYNNAYVTVNKLTSRSPQQGIIKKFFVGIGDFVEVGTPLFSLDVSKNSQIQVSLSFEELLSLSGINEAYIDIFDQSGALTTIT
ncbi:hypothetical protein IJM86_03880 [bacterium]|nr:hypothetical protein [bacterium]